MSAHRSAIAFRSDHLPNLSGYITCFWPFKGQ
ncbi:hypothetical protein PND17_00885 [Streptococcus thermophilus]|nr:hypothetical protein [Streptococcus thermophilus]MDA5537624.1 hypothetical protein [Streptococcus thermophilus]WCL61094.1 hypothetical protein PND17_00885 [Streptococcus thermophilus]